MSIMDLGTGTIGSKISSFILWILAILAPITSVLWTIFFLLCADFVTGIWAAYKKGGLKAIKARRMMDSVSKIILYNLGVITSYYVGIHLAPEIPFMKLTTGIIAIVEMKSVYENINTVTGTEFWNTIKSTISKKYSERKNGNT